MAKSRKPRVWTDYDLGNMLDDIDRDMQLDDGGPHWKSSQPDRRFNWLFAIHWLLLCVHSLCFFVGLFVIAGWLYRKF